MDRTTLKIEHKIRKLYESYFLKNNISSCTGKLKNKNLKFASYPFVGSNYYSGILPRMLFVGLDIGRDESPNRILGFNEKRKIVEGLDYNLKKMNPHIAGTFITTIFCLRNGLFKKEWNKIRHAKSYKDGIKIFHRYNHIKPLASIGLINLFKFVTPGRKKRLGGADRKHIFKAKETRLLLDEIDIFSPHIIIFQSNQFKTNKYLQRFMKELIKKRSFDVMVGSHPSYRGARTPLALSKTQVYLPK